jgi:acyl-coenzyme A synthetase/AMP-(fatty) acid ligase
MDNAAALFVDAPVEEGLGDRAAVVTPAGSLDYAGLQRLTDRAAHALRALGVEPEQRVALLMADGAGWAATFFGALKLGAVAVPINTRLGPADLRTVLADCRPRVLVADLPLLEAAAIDPAALGIRAALDFEALVRDASTGPVRPEPVGADAMAFWLYTSGTTGSPKAAVHCHRTLPACRHYRELLGVTAADRVFATSKLFFAYALGNQLLIPLFARATAYLHPGWPDPAEVARVMREFAPTLFFSVPTVYARLLRADLPAETFRSARLCVSAGERLPGDVYEAWRARFGVEILDGIGATETVFMVLSNRPGSSTRRAGRCRTARRGSSGSGPRRRPRRTTGGSTTPGGPSWATGSGPAMSTGATPTATTSTAAARTTSSRWRGSGCRPPRWSRCCFGTRRCSTAGWWGHRRRAG